MVEPSQLEQYANDPELARSNIACLFESLVADESRQNYAVEALENCGAPEISQIPVLLHALSSGESLAVYWASTLLGRLLSDGPVETAGLAQVELEQALCESLKRSLDLSAHERILWAFGKASSLQPTTREVLEQLRTNASPRMERLIETALHIPVS
ncbi:MAG: hypothetical protein KGQ60_05105 [Planctomycetes bacterium]|nr:hypothetical protein [Planctomycetota bacterium]